MNNDNQDLTIPEMRRLYHNVPDHLHTNNFITTYTGKAFDVVCPKCRDVDIKDIAHGLSNVCRYSGQCKTFYSVAEHCYRLSKMFDSSEYKVAALLHDAAEAYMSDVPTPVKYRANGYRETEFEILATISIKFSFTRLFRLMRSPEFRAAEEKLLSVEVYSLLTSTEAWTLHEVPTDWIVETMAPVQAESHYLNEFTKAFRSIE